MVWRAATTFSSMTPMATSADLLRLGFQASVVAARQLNIEHPAPVSLGPFCRLAVTTTAPAEAGVYAWVVDDIVSYVGRASHLIHVCRALVSSGPIRTTHTSQGPRSPRPAAHECASMGS